MSGCRGNLLKLHRFRYNAFYNLQGIEMKAKMKGFMLENRIIAHLTIGFIILLVLATSVERHIAKRFDHSDSSTRIWRKLECC